MESSNIRINQSIAYSRDGRWLASASVSGVREILFPGAVNLGKAVNPWDVTKGTLQQTFDNSFGGGPIAFSHDSKRLAYVDGGDIYICDTTTGVVLQVLGSSTEFMRSWSVRCIAFTSDDTRLVSASEGMNVQFWDVTSGVLQNEYETVSC